MRLITFTFPVSPYNRGETAGFDDVVADRYVQQKVAQYVGRRIVPEKLPEPEAEPAPYETTAVAESPANRMMGSENIRRQSDRRKRW